MKIAIATTDNIPELRKLWKISFNCNLSFLSFYFNNGFPLSKCFIAFEDGIIISTLSIFSLTYIKNKKIIGGYVYGVCTHPEFRDKGIAQTLLAYAEQESHIQGLQFLLLKPATPSLFDFYRKLGFSTTLYRMSATLPLLNNDIPYSALSINGESMFYLRRNFLKNNYFEWDREMSDFILSYIKYSNGFAVEFDNGEYMIGISSDVNPKIFDILEAGIGYECVNNIESTSLYLISNLVKSKYSQCESLNIHFPLFKNYLYNMDYNREPFALYKPMGYECADNAFFNFSME